MQIPCRYQRVPRMYCFDFFNFFEKKIKCKIETSIPL